MKMHILSALLVVITINILVNTVTPFQTLPLVSGEENQNSTSISNENNQNSSNIDQTKSPLLFKTENNAVSIKINWNQEIQPGIPLIFFLDFTHPFSGMKLQHVNYNLDIINSSGENVFSKENIHTHIGEDAQDLVFENQGTYDIIVTVLGTGVDPPFDTTRSGVGSISITV
ncbi:MAG: hypothetical protein ACPKPY_13900 [Nitrososphaeraceae archaeon]